MQTYPCANPKCKNRWHHSPECPNETNPTGSAKGFSANESLLAPPSTATNVDETGELGYSPQDLNTRAREDIIETLESGYSGYYNDLHQEVFNTSYFIVGTQKAKEAMGEYGVFDAMEKIQEYENDVFGETNTELGNPEKVANMLYYIVGEEQIGEMNEVSETWDECQDGVADDETNERIAQELREAWF